MLLLYKIWLEFSRSKHIIFHEFEALKFQQKTILFKSLLTSSSSFYFSSSVLKFQFQFLFVRWIDRRMKMMSKLWFQMLKRMESSIRARLLGFHFLCKPVWNRFLDNNEKISLSWRNPEKKRIWTRWMAYPIQWLEFKLFVEVLIRFWLLILNLNPKSTKILFLKKIRLSEIWYFKSILISKTELASQNQI